MVTNWKANWIVAACAAVLLASIGPGHGLAQSKKPGGGGAGSGGPAGTVFFQSRSEDPGEPLVTSSIKADGSGDVVLLFADPDRVRLTEASHVLHAGQRWFLSWGDGYTALGSWTSYITATNEFGELVPLFSSSDFTFIEGEPHWMRAEDDGWVSFEGTRWYTDPLTGVQTPIEEGIFRVQVAFDADGDIIGGVPGSWELVLSTLPFDAQPHGHDWGPGGELLFVTRVQNPDGGSATQLWMADVTDPGDPVVVPVNTGSTHPISSPSWSPDGSKLAFNESTTGIVILFLSNGSRKTIKSNATTGVGRALWAPTGTGIVYQRTRSSNRITEVYRANADGSGQTYLATGWALGWR